MKRCIQLKSNVSLKNLAIQIEETKMLLNDLIVKKDYNLLDRKVIQVSQRIDKLLLQYQSIK